MLAWCVVSFFTCFLPAFYSRVIDVSVVGIFLIVFAFLPVQINFVCGAILVIELLLMGFQILAEHRPFSFFVLLLTLRDRDSRKSPWRNSANLAAYWVLSFLVRFVGLFHWAAQVVFTVVFIRVYVMSFFTGDLAVGRRFTRDDTMFAFFLTVVWAVVFPEGNLFSWAWVLRMGVGLLAFFGLRVEDKLASLGIEMNAYVFRALMSLSAQLQDKLFKVLTFL